MNAQTELIPKTAADEAREVLIHLEGEVLRRDKALATAREKYDEAVEWAGKQRELLQRLEAEERQTVTAETVEPQEEEPPEEEAEDAEVLEIDGVAVTEDGTAYETKTGEVVEPPDDEPGEGVVYVLWPDMADAVESDVGPFTRYAELIADGLAEGEDADDFEVRGPVEDCEGDELPICDPDLVIHREHWSKTFRVVAKGEKPIPVCFAECPSCRPWHLGPEPTHFCERGQGETIIGEPCPFPDAPADGGGEPS